jgi:hypothetical protein
VAQDVGPEIKPQYYKNKQTTKDNKRSRQVKLNHAWHRNVLGGCHYFALLLFIYSCSQAPGVSVLTVLAVILDRFSNLSVPWAVED